MDSLSHSETRSLYSWWWDSHISPKNSKWLQENLTDMDAKVKAMIKLIEEDADSFARRAEMYYKKRPELMKLVEEFYRAYRALAERYDYATSELRHAHKTMAEAFPNQMPCEFSDDSPSRISGSDTEPHTPEKSHPAHALLDPEYLHKDALGIFSTGMQALKIGESGSGISKRGLKKLHAMFGPGEVATEDSEVAQLWKRKGLNSRETEEREQSLQGGLSQLIGENKNLKTQILSESVRAAKAEAEIQNLKDILARIQAEKEAVFTQYLHYLEKFSDLERELNQAQEDAGDLDERAWRAEIEIHVLKETLAVLESEREAGLIQYKRCRERISSLEIMMSVAQEGARGLTARATTAETEAQNLKEELSRVEAEKDVGLLQYKHGLEKISVLEKKILLSEEDSRMLNEQIGKAGTEVRELKQALEKLNEEKEATAILYNQCLETTGKMEIQISRAEENVEQLNNEICKVTAKLKNSEEHRDLLEKSNQSLRSEADHLAQKIAVKDEELLKTQTDLERLQCSFQDEHLRFVKVEATLQAVQALHSKSQEEQRSLTSELINVLQMLKDLELHKHGFEEEIQLVKEENQSLNEMNLSSTASIKILEDEILSLKGMKKKLEEEFSLQTEQSSALLNEIYNLKVEISGLNERYQALILQVESVGLNPNYLESSVTDLQNESLKLKEICERERDEREALYEKLNNMDKILENNSVLQSSWSELNIMMGGSREKVKELQESCQFLQGEKSTLMSEKAILLSQLQIITENMQKLLEKNTLLENSLAGANIEIDGLREKSNSLEEYCKQLSAEKLSLLNEKSTMVSQLEHVQQRLEVLEKRFTSLEEKCAGLDKEKQTTLSQVEELRGSLNLEKQVHASYLMSSEARLAGLENSVCNLQEVSKLGRKEFEEELDKALNSQVEIFILQKFIKELEEKNYTLLIECQRHVEASRLSDKLISELEGENLEQQVEAEFLLDEIEKLRRAINLVFRALQIDSEDKREGSVVQEQITLPHLLESINGLKCSLYRNEDEKQHLLVENLVFITLLEEMRFKGLEFGSEKNILDKKLNMITDKCTMLQEEKIELQEMNRRLGLEKSIAVQQEEVLKAEMGTVHMKLVNVVSDNLVLREENSKLLAEKRCSMKNFSDLKEEKHAIEEESSDILCEAVDLRVLSCVLKSFGTEKATELKALTEDTESLRMINGNLRKDIELLEKKLEIEEAENLHLNESVEELNKEVNEIRELNDQLNHQITISKDLLAKQAKEFSETNQELEASKNLNTELCASIQELKKECEESKLYQQQAEKHFLELSDTSVDQNKEIQNLRTENENLGTEVSNLCKEVEEHRIREENLNSELQQRSNAFELWEAEASTFYFDLQISTIREVLIKDKVHELTGICQRLENVSNAKSVQIEQMKEKTVLLESEIGGLRAQLSAYVPVVASLNDNIASLEYKTLLRTNYGVGDVQEQQDEELENLHNEKCRVLREDASCIVPDGLLDLRKMQSRIREVEKVVGEEMEKLALQGSTNIRENSVVKENEEFESRNTTYQEKNMHMRKADVKERSTDNRKSQTTKPEVKSGALMKDIPLDQVSDSAFYRTNRRHSSDEQNDQMFELWNTTELDHRGVPIIKKTQKRPPRRSEDRIQRIKDVVQGPSQLPESNVERELGVDKLEVPTSIMLQKKAGKKTKFLERLISDSQKLTCLQTTITDLKKEMDMNKKRRKGKDVEYETVKRQLQKVDEAVFELVHVNDQLMKSTEEFPSSLDATSVELEDTGNDEIKNVAEQARKGSEKIGRLQFELQNIQYVLLKLEDEKKSSGKYRFSVSKTSVILKDFISSGRKSSVRRKKGCLCGCMRPSPNGHG